MTSYFADTFYFPALLNLDDAAHIAADIWSQRRDISLVTTVWVLTELADGYCAPPAREIFAGFYDMLMSDAHARVIEADPRLFKRGMSLYRNRPDKRWSLTDCISFQVMQEEGIQEALTGDHHFEQAGFVALMK